MGGLLSWTSPCCLRRAWIGYAMRFGWSLLERRSGLPGSWRGIVSVLRRHGCAWQISGRWIPAECIGCWTTVGTWLI